MVLNIVTKNKELYSKMKKLKISDEVFIEKKDSRGVNNIVDKINHDGNNVMMRDISGNKLIQALRPVNFNIYYRRR